MKIAVSADCMKQLVPSTVTPHKPIPAISFDGLGTIIFVSTATANAGASTSFFFVSFACELAMRLDGERISGPGVEDDFRSSGTDCVTDCEDADFTNPIFLRI